jgi:hypothetical protein
MAAATTIAPALNQPPLTAPQHMRALARANEIRLARAALKRRIAAENLSAAEVVMECPQEADSMTIAELLSAQRRWGRARSRRLLNLLDLKENKSLGSLTERQRRLLAHALRKRGSCP